MSNLPKSVQRQLVAAEAQAAAQAQAMTQSQTGVLTDVAGLAVQPEPQSATPPAPAPVPAPAPTPAPAEDWQQKYRSLQGVFAQQVPELRATVKRYESEMATLKQQVLTLSQVQQPRQEPPKAEVDPRDVNAFGQDMIDMVKRYAQQTFTNLEREFRGAIAGFDQRLKALEQAMSGVSERNESTLEAQFYATLNQLVPDWKVTNADEAWLSWLGEMDEVFRVPRQAALNAAFGRLDAEGVAAAFRKFKDSRPAKPTPPPITPDSGGGAANTPPPQPAKPIISQKAVNAFYTDLARGRYAGREAEAARIEAEINQAAVEGRIM